jgi:hypothetical protein
MFLVLILQSRDGIDSINLIFRIDILKYKSQNLRDMDHKAWSSL